MLDAITAYLVPVIGAALAGGVIGLEREWRGRAAGLRTHILVSLASALLMQAAMTQGRWAFLALPAENIVTDPTRMAHGVLTGIGFLCAGVIFRTGFSIHGLTTAASLWITSAIGILFGVGLYGLGALATVATALILVALRLISLRLPAQTILDVEVRWAVADGDVEAAVEDALKQDGLKPKPDRIELIEDGRLIVRTWRIAMDPGSEVKSLAVGLAGISGVRGYRLAPRDD